MFGRETTVPSSFFACGATDLNAAHFDQDLLLPFLPTLLGANLPVNLAQIAHDLDAKLLEFTLMAKAREQIADKAHTAEEVEKDAWRQGETKRVEDMVRALSNILSPPLPYGLVYMLIARGPLPRSPCFSAFMSFGR